MFNNTRTILCPIVSYTMTQVPFNNSMLDSSTFSNMISITAQDEAQDQQMEIRTQDILITFPQEIRWSIEARTAAGVSQIQNFKLDV